MRLKCLLATLSTLVLFWLALNWSSGGRKLTSHWVEAAQCVQVPRWSSCCLLKELQIKLDITPKNKTRVRVRAGSASGRNCITPQPERRHKWIPAAHAPHHSKAQREFPEQHSQSTTTVKLHTAPAAHCSQSNSTLLSTLNISNAEEKL